MPAECTTCLLYTSLVPGRKRVPRPAAGMIAFMLFKDPFAGAKAPHASVSYTHLDVYKRQWMDRRCRVGARLSSTTRPSMTSSRMSHTKAVSYTHLDVYKRQENGLISRGESSERSSFVSTCAPTLNSGVDTSITFASSPLPSVQLILLL